MYNLIWVVLVPEMFNPSKVLKNHQANPKSELFYKLPAWTHHNHQPEKPLLTTLPPPPHPTTTPPRETLPN